MFDLKCQEHTGTASHCGEESLQQKSLQLPSLAPQAYVPACVAHLQQEIADRERRTLDIDLDDVATVSLTQHLKAEFPAKKRLLNLNTPS